MKKRIWFFLMIILGLIITSSCKKDNSFPANTVKDIDGNVYHTVTIGTQVWMVENLKSTRYRNGELIGSTIPATLDISGEAEPKYQWAYDGDEKKAEIYGRLYTWYAATDSRNICPAGWHVPSNDEWTVLINYLGGLSVAGDKLKEAGFSHWYETNMTVATNESGFTALPGGVRAILGNFHAIGGYGYWWSSTEEEVSRSAWYLCLVIDDLSGSDIVQDCMWPKVMGFSVRCLKDE